MTQTIGDVAGNILDCTVTQAGGSPGVVAMATNKAENYYVGAAGVRELGQAQAMTADSVMLLASCTKALTGVVLMQLIEEGQVSLQDAVRDYVPEIAEIEVLEGFDDNGEPRTRKPKTENRHHA